MGEEDDLVECPACARCKQCGGTTIPGEPPRCSRCDECPVCGGRRLVTEELAQRIEDALDDSE